MRKHSRYRFMPEKYEQELCGIVEALAALEAIDDASLTRVLKLYPKDGSKTFSKSEIIQGYRHWAPLRGWSHPDFVMRLRMKPVRTESGVAPVTVLTKPFPCPGRCIFCPSDVRLPKSYLAMEPGAQRALQHEFDPFGQVESRLAAFHLNGHRVDKTELIILGGTWTSYPESYQRWYVKRCFDAANSFRGGGDRPAGRPSAMASLGETDGWSSRGAGYDDVVIGRLRSLHGGALVSASEDASWESLEEVQRENEGSAVRIVGLTLETRPDQVSVEELVRLRRLGATKIQLGIQSLDDEVLWQNRRGHDVSASHVAVQRLRSAGFKLHVHWMPNLLGSTPEKDVEDFGRLFESPAIRPDELKIYPCSLVKTAELMEPFEKGRWRPYTHEELLFVLTECLARVPRYCRVTRVVRDIPAHDIVEGNRRSNFRELAEKALRARGIRLVDIRSREIRGGSIEPSAVDFEQTRYESSIGEEVFIEARTSKDRIVGFARLSLPGAAAPIPEIGESALLREVHVYGGVAGIGGGRANAQHHGLGRRLIEIAAREAGNAGFRELAVISAVGTRIYYRGLGFADGPLYQHLSLPGRSIRGV